MSNPSLFPGLSFPRSSGAARSRVGVTLAVLAAAGLVGACGDDDSGSAAPIVMSNAGCAGASHGEEGNGSGGMGGDGTKEPGGCTDTQLSCDGKCIDPDTDEAHCGSCDVECKSGQVCDAGHCTTTTTTTPEAPNSIDTGLTGVVNGYSLQLKIDGDGDAVILWTIIVNAKTALYANTYDASKKTWSAPHELADATYGASQLALDAEGNAYVLWTDGDAGIERDVWLSRFDKTTGDWGTGEIIDQADLQTDYAALAVAGNGVVTAAWSELQTGAPAHLVVRRSQPDGKFEDDAVTLATDVSGKVVIGGNDDGEAFPVWDGDGGALYAIHWDGSAWSEPEVIIEADSHLYFGGKIRVFVSDSGEATVAAERKVYNASPSADSVWAVRYEGGAWKEAVSYIADAYNAYGMDASMATNGDVFVSWIEHDTPDFAPKLGALRLDAATGEWSESVDVPLPSHANLSLIAANNQGGALGIATLSSVFYRELVFSSTFTGADDTLSEVEVFPTNDFDNSPFSIAYGKDGKGLAVWTSSSTVESQLFWREL